MEYKIKDIFHIHGGVSGLTEKFIYEHPPLNEDDALFVYSGSNTESNYRPKISSKSVINKFGENSIHNSLLTTLLKVTRKGKAGVITSVFKKKFVINDDAYVFEFKKQYEEVINLSYIINKLPNLFCNCISDSNGNGTFNKTLAGELIIDIPHIDVQNKIVEESNIILNYRSSIELLHKKIQELYDFRLKLIGDFFLVKDICKLETGATIGEDLIYQNYDINGVPVFSSKIDGPIGFVNKNLYINSNKKGYSGDLIWATRGNAGNVKIINKDFLFTSNCGRMTINNAKLINAEFLKIVLNMIIKDKVIGKANLGQLTIDQIGEVGIHIPNMNIQEEIVEHYKKIDLISIKLNEIII